MRGSWICALALLAACGSESKSKGLWDAAPDRDAGRRDTRAADVGEADLTPQLDIAWAVDAEPIPDHAGPDHAGPDGAAPDDAGADLAGDTGDPADGAPDLAADVGPAVDQLLNDAGAPANASCSAPATIALSGGSVTVNGDTTGAADEFVIDCAGELWLPMEGPQVYYRVTLPGGKNYKIVGTPLLFDIALYAFPASTSCTAATIDAACATPTVDRAARHNADDQGAGDPEVLRINPAVDEDWIIVVDSYDVGEYGVFELTISEYTPPANGACSAPKAIPLTTSPTTETGDTSDATNEFGTDVDCNSGFAFEGPQLYYQLDLAAGTTYTITVTPPSTWDPALYAFTDTTCTAATIQTQCTAANADVGWTGDPETLTLTPTVATTYIVAVDCAFGGEGGTFSLEISW